MVTKQADETLSAILKFEEGRPEETEMPEGTGLPESATPPDRPAAPPDRPFMKLPDMESNYMTRFFVVRFDSAGEGR
ncbi:MAG: hypothetical protein K6E75_02090 [Lachnospiraceae bacterium]|nr:hypothetical protein [Lachnospiraceae bacterium]